MGSTWIQGKARHDSRAVPGTYRIGRHADDEDVVDRAHKEVLAVWRKGQAGHRVVVASIDRVSECPGRGGPSFHNRHIDVTGVQRKSTNGEGLAIGRECDGENRLVSRGRKGRGKRGTADIPNLDRAIR